MDEQLWIALSFVLFVYISRKYVSNFTSNYLASASSKIRENILEAEQIYLEAKEKNEEAKILLAQKELTKKYIHEKEEREIEFDLEERKKGFEEMINIKKNQFQNMTNRTLTNLKSDTLNKINKQLKDKFIAYLGKNHDVEEKFTNIMLDVN